MMKEKIINLTRNIIAVFLVFFGFITLFIYFIIGIGVIFLGVSISPLLYEKTKLNNIKYIQLLLPIGAFIFLILSLIIVASFSPDLPKNVADDNPENSEVIETLSDNIQEETKKVEITNMTFNESGVEMDLKDTKELILEVQPEDADLENIESIEFFVSDDKVMNFEKISNEKNKIKIMLKPVSEGKCEIFAKSKNDILSNKIELKINNSERIKAEELARQEEEKKKKEAEELAKKEAEKSKNETSTNKQSNSTTQQSNKKGSSSYNNSHGKAIYITPHGKKYHYDPDCGGKNSTRVSLEEAKNSGRTPCKKCVY